MEPLTLQQTVIIIISVIALAVSAIDYSKGRVPLVEWVLYGMALIGLYGHLIIQELKYKLKVDNDE